MNIVEMRGPDWQQWATQAQTKEFLKLLRVTVQRVQDEIIERRHQDSSNIYLSALKTESAITLARTLVQIVYEIETIEGAQDVE